MWEFLDAMHGDFFHEQDAPIGPSVEEGFSIARCLMPEVPILLQKATFIAQGDTLNGLSGADVFDI